jgi:hypothetical protein
MSKNERLAFPNDAKGPVLAERDLWVGVINQALSDVFTAGYDEYSAAKAMIWFINNSRDYKAVCDFAGVDAACIRNVVIDRIAALRLIVSTKLILPEKFLRNVILNNKTLLRLDTWGEICSRCRKQMISIPANRAETSQDVYDLCFLRCYAITRYKTNKNAQKFLTRYKDRSVTQDQLNPAV